MHYILNIETATKNCSVAIAADGTVVSLREVAETGYSHAEKLHVFIEEVLLESGIKFSDLAAVAVSRGPGSYTGLRIGVSAAKGLCYALRVPLIATDTLQALALQAHVSDGVVIPMIDARRMEVYSSVYGSSGENHREIRAEIIDQDSFSEIDDQVYFVGDCAAKCQHVLTRPNFRFLHDVVYPSAREMAMLSYNKYRAQDFEDLAYFEPFYLKDFLVTPAKK